MPVRSPSSPRGGPQSPKKDESVDTTVIVPPSSQSQLLPENPFAVDMTEFAPLVVDLAVNPFDDTDVVLSEVPEAVESPSAAQSTPLTKTVNPFGEEKELVIKEEEVQAKIVTKAVVNPFDATSEEETGNPFDAASEEEESGNPFDVQNEEKKQTNPFDAVSEEEESGNPFDVKESSRNPFDATSEEEETGNPFDTEKVSTNPFDTQNDKEAVVITPALNPFADSTTLTPTAVDTNPFANVDTTPVEVVEEKEESESDAESEAVQLARLKQEEERRVQELLLKQRMEEEKKAEEARIAEAKRREEEQLLAQKRDFENQEMDRLCFEQSLRVGIPCTKWCRNNKSHRTIVKLIDLNHVASIQWVRKKTLLRTQLASLSLEEIMSIEDVRDSPIFALKTLTRELRLEMPNQSKKCEVMNGLKQLCPNLA